MKQVRCKNCGCPKAAMHLGDFYKNETGCARGEEVSHGQMCQSLELELMREAMHRLLCPEFFDENGKPIGKLFDRIKACTDTTNQKLRERAMARGPLLKAIEGTNNNG